MTKVTNALLALPNNGSVCVRIDGLIGRALEQYGSLEAIPCTAFVEDITSYKRKRRR